MGARGPAPKSTALRLVQGGTSVSHRPLPANEPKPRLASDEIPAHYWWLDILAKAFWMRMAPELVRTKVLAVTHLDKFAMTAQAYARWVRAEREGASPSEITRWQQAFNRLGAQFGLSPSDQTRVAAIAEGQTPEDDF